MRKFSSNYCSEDNNYIININLRTNNLKNNLYSTYCVIQNILQRGKSTKPSNFLLKSIGNYTTKKNIRYISKENNNWDLSIKGNDSTNDNPALIFFNKILSNELKDLAFIRNLIIPEIEINDITGEENKDFINNRVDFYLPQCNLVIEIDGSQHQEELNKLIDIERDDYLKKFNIDTLRITAKEIKEYLNNNKSCLCEKINFIYDKCKSENEIINNKKFITNIENNEKKCEIYDSILRFQILILELLKGVVLNINSEKWTLNILNHDVEFPYEIAIEDLFKWIKHILNLQGQKLRQISVDINKVNNFEKINVRVNIDFSLLKRWDDNCYEENICYVRSDYLHNREYFKVETAELIRYKIVPYREKGANIQSLKYILENVFGFNNFNNGQLSIISNALMLNDTIGLLPTGGGKSLCYHMCCMLQPTINFIVVPIK